MVENRYASDITGMPETLSRLLERGSTSEVDFRLDSELLKKQALAEALFPLNDRERQVVELRFGIEDGRTRTLRQVGEAIGRSSSTAWRIERSALKKLHSHEVSKETVPTVDKPTQGI